MIALRPATMADADDLFAWRNDPVTCANSRSTAAVSREDHGNWMRLNVMQGYPQHMVFIADGEYGRMGVVRFDAARDDGMRYEVSLTVAPAFRGHGFGWSMLSAACEFMAEYTIEAEIRVANKASARIFTECGFAKAGQRDGFVRYRREAQ